MAAKKKTKAPPPELTVAGRMPPALEVGGDVGQLGQELVAAEQLARSGALHASKLAFDAVRAREDIEPALAIRLLEALPQDLGEIPDNIDCSVAKTAPQMKKLQASFDALTNARDGRESTFATLYGLAARDGAFQKRAWKSSLDALPTGSHLFRGAVRWALLSAPALAPEIETEIVALARLRRADADTATAIAALFRHGKADAHLPPFLLDAKTTDELLHAKLIVEEGDATGAFSRAPETWRGPLGALAKRGDEPWSPSEGDLGRARFQAGNAAKSALAVLKKQVKAATAPARESPTAPVPTRTASTPTAPRMAAAPIDRKKLRTGAQREAALDALGAWVVDELVAADDDRAREVLHGAIDALYTIREAAGQERGEFAGHFFTADAVGLDSTGREVPWHVLAKRVDRARLDHLTRLFEQAERVVE